MTGLPNVKVEEQEFKDVQTLLQLDEETLDPERHYRWVHFHPLKVARHRMRHYEFVDKNSGVKTLAGYYDDTGDSMIRIGDTVLMSCPKGEFLARKKGQRRFAESRLTAPAKQFRKQAKKHKAKVIRDEEEE